MKPAEPRQLNNALHTSQILEAVEYAPLSCGFSTTDEGFALQSTLAKFFTLSLVALGALTLQTSSARR